MSDIAVTWAKAQTVLGRDGKRDRNAKDVLVYVASYANAYGYVFARVAMLAFEMEVDERQVQRGLSAIRCKPDDVSGFMEETGRHEVYDGKRYPLYRLRLERGPCNTLEALRANSRDPGSVQAEAAEVGGAAEPRGDTGATPSGSRGDTGATPSGSRGDTGTTPSASRGDTGATQIGKFKSKREAEASPLRAAPAREGGLDFWGVFNAIGEAVPPAMRAITKWKLAKSAYSRASRKVLRPEALLAAAEAYAADHAVRARQVLPGLEVWLAEEMWRPFLPVDGAKVEAAAAAAAASSAAALAGAPADVLDAVARRGEAWARSWLTGAVWREDLQAIVCPREFSADKVRDVLGGELRALGVKVLGPSAAPSETMGAT